MTFNILYNYSVSVYFLSCAEEPPNNFHDILCLFLLFLYLFLSFPKSTIKESSVYFLFFFFMSSFVILSLTENPHSLSSSKSFIEDQSNLSSSKSHALSSPTWLGIQCLLSFFYQAEQVIHSLFSFYLKRNTSWIPAIARNDNTYVIPNLFVDPDQIFISIIKRIGPYDSRIYICFLKMTPFCHSERL